MNFSYSLGISLIFSCILYYIFEKIILIFSSIRENKIYIYVPSYLSAMILEVIGYFIVLINIVDFYKLNNFFVFISLLILSVIRFKNIISESYNIIFYAIFNNENIFNLKIAFREIGKNDYKLSLEKIK